MAVIPIQVTSTIDCVGKCLSDWTVQLGTSNSFANLYDQYRPILFASVQMSIKTIVPNHYFYHWPVKAIIHVQFHNVCYQGRIQDLIRGGAPDRDRPKTAILGPQFCRIFGAGASFLVVRGGPGPPGPPPWIRPWLQCIVFNPKTQIGVELESQSWSWVLSQSVSRVNSL